MEYFPLHKACPLETLPTMASISRAHGGEYIYGVSSLGKPLNGFLTFCDRLPAGDEADPDCSSTILVPHELESGIAGRFPAAKLVAVGDPRSLFIDTLEYLQKADLLGATSLLPASPGVSSDVRVGENVVIEPGVQIDKGVTIKSGSVVRAATWLKSGVTIGENSVVGGVGINAYLGRDGKRRGFPHLAGVIVGEGAALGASCVVVRGILSSTRIGSESVVGNLCNIGHGVEIAGSVWMSVGVIVGGHTRIGDKATLGQGCVIRDNITIGAGANVGMGAVVTKSVRAGRSVFGNPARQFRSINAGPAR